MVLLWSCTLRIRTVLRWHPDIRTAHIDSSHSEKLSLLIDGSAKIQILISWAAPQEHSRFIWPSFTSPGALICRTRLPYHHYERLHSSKSNEEKRHNVLKCSPFPSLLPDLHSSSAIVSEQAVIVLFVCNRAAYEVRRFRLARDSLALSAPPSAGFAVIQEIKHSSCSLQFRPQFLLLCPAPFSSRNAPPRSLVPVSASQDRQAAVDQWIT